MKSLWLSPISIEALEAILIARSLGNDVNLICSVGQVGPQAYTGFTHEVFAKQLDRLGRKHEAWPLVERDHLGRGGEDMLEWLERDVQSKAFTGAMLHIFQPSKQVDKILDQFDLTWQIGPGEDDSKRCSKDLWKRYAKPGRWVSFPNGCLIDSLSNRGAFDAKLFPATGKASIRGHNCDYLGLNGLRQVANHCDGLNVAPQLGCIQSCFYVLLGRSFGYRLDDWVAICERDAKNISRWCSNKTQAVQGVGHYHYTALEWRDVVRPLVVDYLVQVILRWCEVIGCRYNANGGAAKRSSSAAPTW